MPESRLNALLDDKVAVVTGAARGLGLTIAKVLGQLGATLALLDVDLPGCEAAARSLEQAAVRALALQCDVTDETAVEAAASQVGRLLGRADVLVNNAGVDSRGPLEDLSWVDWNRVMAVNLGGYFLCAKHFGRIMLRQGKGSIVNIASIAGSSPAGGLGAYSASKAAVIMLTKQMAVEWGPRGIRANSISPGMMRTPMSEHLYSGPAETNNRARVVPSRRVGEPRDMAQVVAFLAGDDSSYVNGQDIAVDGGVTAMLIRLLPGMENPEAKTSTPQSPA